MFVSGIRRSMPDRLLVGLWTDKTSEPKAMQPDSSKHVGDLVSFLLVCCPFVVVILFGNLVLQSNNKFV